MNGRINSFQSLGAVDGPGLRFVIFMQGCPLRCAYCHNPESWDGGMGDAFSPEEVVGKILRYKPYFGAEGGVTVSGGEPLAQAEFTARLFSLLKSEGVHTALDTSGTCDPARAEAVLLNTDLVICDLKFATEEMYAKYAGGSIHPVLEFLNLTERLNIPLWIRHVVVPGLTDSREEIQSVLNIAEKYSNLEKIELLPFKNICQVKYDNLGQEFPLKDTPPCDDETLFKLKALIPQRYR